MVVGAVKMSKSVSFIYSLFLITNITDVHNMKQITFSCNSCSRKILDFFMDTKFQAVLLL